MHDIHMHIIPGVDDGSWSRSMSDSMLEMAHRQGIRKIIATPHSSAFDDEDCDVRTAFYELKEHMEKIFPDMELYLGSEVRFHKEKLDDTLDKLNAGIYPSLNETKYILTEFSAGIEQEEAGYCTQALCGSGWIPVIAHAERYRNLFGTDDCMKKWEDLMGYLRKTPVERELEQIAKEETRLLRQAEKYVPARWKETLESKIPEKVYDNLRKAFCRAFELIFEKGTPLIEKTYQKEELEKEFQVRDFAVDLKKDRRELRKMKSRIGQNNLANIAVSTAEGVGLGVLGIGLPDIVLFVSMILRGTYETALQYGFAYDTPGEKLWILKLLECSMQNGEGWIACNEEIDRMLRQEFADPDSDELKKQIRSAADAFAVDMLLAKFIQGLPLAGIAGGLANPVYYNRILKFVQMKYRKRYLLKKYRENGS